MAKRRKRKSGRKGKRSKKSSKKGCGDLKHKVRVGGKTFGVYAKSVRSGKSRKKHMRAFARKC